MKKLPYTFLILLILFSACSTSKAKYEVHLVEGGGYHHLITAETENEALDFIDDKSIVFFHDFTYKPWYHTILKWYKVIEIIDTLAVLRRK